MRSCDYSDPKQTCKDRSGRYLYKPNLRDSCCPQYTIRYVLVSQLWTTMKMH